MLPKVWNMQLPPFPREGLNHLDPSPNCQVSMHLRSEAARLARLSQLDFPENISLSELKKFQARLRKKIWEKLGCKYDPGLDLDTTYLETIQEESFCIRKLIYQSRPGLYVSALLYIPNGADETHKAPAILHMHGHHPDGKINPLVQMTVTDLVREGFVCLSVDAFGTFERAHVHGTAEYHGGWLGSSLFNIGETLMGAQLVDNMRGVDLLRSLPFVKKDLIGATGASGGGNQTTYLAAMDSRITAAMPVVSVGSFESYVTGVNCVCELLPDGLTFTEQTGVLALIAPRPLRIGNAFYDVNHTFSVGEMLKTYSQVERLYQALGSSHLLAYTITPDVHGYRQHQREAAIGFFRKHLKGEGEGAPVPEKEYTAIPPAEIQVFSSGEVRPEKVRSIPTQCRMMGDLLREKLLSTTAFSGAGKRRELKKLLRFSQFSGSCDLRKYTTREGYERYALDTGDRLIPFLLRPGTKKGKYHIFAAPEGKGALTPEELAIAEKDKESNLIFFDPYGEGETAQSNVVLGLRSQTSRQLLWLGRTLAGEWICDLRNLVRCLRQKFRAETLHITGLREMGVCAIFAAALQKEESFTVTALDTPASFLFRRDSIPTFQRNPFALRLDGCLYSCMLALPGFLQWGDVSLAAALAGGRVKFDSPRAYDGTPYTEQEIKALRKEISLLESRIQ